ncbi:uncharacterized protein LOC101862654 [Aplysia californica]|uniref:Phosphoglycerate kinase n=1 Tax=Aplysia californica TaxID=6500 RepID=A0ABM1VUK1_APLCA|nr:uncharacterized protein LOC101862654 [Aplysia californica]
MKFQSGAFVDHGQSALTNCFSGDGRACSRFLPYSCRGGSQASTCSFPDACADSSGEDLLGRGVYRTRSNYSVMPTSSGLYQPSHPLLRRCDSETDVNSFDQMYVPTTTTTNNNTTANSMPASRPTGGLDFNSGSIYDPYTGKGFENEDDVMRRWKNQGQVTKSSSATKTPENGVKSSGPRGGTSKKNNENNNFLIQRRGSFGGHATSWRDEHVFDRIDVLAQPKSLPPEYQCQWRSVYWMPRKEPIRGPDGRALIEYNPRIEELSRPVRVCGEWCGKRHCIWECEYPWLLSRLCKDGEPDPDAMDWSRLAQPKGHCPLPGDDTFNVSRAALKAKATRRLEKLAVPKKVVDCNEYYLWLFNRKPDTDAKLKPVQRLSIDKMDLTEERVFLRCDLDYSQSNDVKGKLAQIMPTIEYILSKDAKAIIIASYCGEPRGRRDDNLSLKKVAGELGKMLKKEVVFLEDCVGPEAQALCEDPEPGSVFVLENMRFNPEEDGSGIDANGKEFTCTKEEVQQFRAKLFNLVDMFVQDSFTDLVEMSNTTVGSNKQDRAYGLTIKAELDTYNNLVTKPKKPMVAVIGGCFKDKIDVVYNLMGKADDILLGGEIAQIFLKTLKGIDIGITPSSPSKEKKVLNAIARAKDISCLLSLPADFVVRNTKKPEEYFTVSTKLDVEPWFEIVDIGHITRDCYVKTLAEAASVVWSGDMGVLLDGTAAVGAAISEATERGADTYIMDEDTHRSFQSICKDGKVTAITGDSRVTSMLLHRKLPKGLASLSPYRKTVKKRPVVDEVVSTKPGNLEQPGFCMDTGFERLCVDRVDVEGKRVLIVADLSVPLYRGVVADNYRLRMVVPTIKWVLKRGAKLAVLLSQFETKDAGRKLLATLRPVSEEMGRLLGEQIIFVPECTGKVVTDAINSAHPGSVIMLENVLEQPEEMVSFSMEPQGTGRVRSPEAVATFCESLSQMCDVYVNDAFSLMDRDRSSITGCMHRLRPCGFLVKNELKYLSKTFNHPPRRFLAILGGNQVIRKMELMKGLLRDVDEIIVTGTLGLHCLMLEQEMRLGRSLDRSVNLTDLEQLLAMAKENNVKLYYPVDLITTHDLGSDSHSKQVSTSEGISNSVYCADVGAKTCSLFSRVIKRAKLVLWCGVAGVVEVKAFSKGTRAIYDTIVEVTKNPETAVISILGGRSVSSFVHSIDPNHEGVSHVTTGYEVALKLLSEKRLVGLDAISFNEHAKARLLNRLSMDQLDIKDKRILLRADFALPPRGGSHDDDSPIKTLANTIKMILKRGATCVVLCGHLGEPNGKRDDSLSLGPVKTALEKILRSEIHFFEAGLTDTVEAACRTPEAGKVYMLENMRFNPEEEGYGLDASDRRINVPYQQIEEYRYVATFLGGDRLSRLADIFINESFGVLRNTDSSIVGIKMEQRAVGPQLKAELSKFATVLPKIESPILAIVGGGEAWHKADLIYNLIDVASDIIVCGDTAFTFLKVAKGMAIGKSPFDIQGSKLVPRVIKKARLNGVQLHFPVDFKVPAPVEPVEEGQEPPEEQPPDVYTLEEGIPDTLRAMDIGEDSVAAFAELIQEAKTILYTGNAGAYQKEQFAEGTKGILQAISDAAEEGAVAMAFGGRTGNCINAFDMAAAFTHISLGTHSCLDLICGRPLVGLESLSSLQDKPLTVLTVQQASLKGEKVLILLDLDVPTVDGVVLDTDKIEDALPTIRYVLEKEPMCVILAGYRGHPKGYKNAYLSMKPLVTEFEHFLERSVAFLANPCSSKTRMTLDDPSPGSVFLMENLMFYPAELGLDEGVPDVLDGEGLGDGAAPIGGGAADSDAASAGHEETEDLKKENIDKLMWELMIPKTVEQYTREIGDLATVFINDDVTHMHDTVTSNNGFEIPVRACGLTMVKTLRQGDAGNLKAPAVAPLSPAPKD